jgi:ribosomal protein S4
MLNEKLVPEKEIFKAPLWVEKNAKKINVSSMPTRDMIDPGIRENLIIEFYSR